MNMLTERWYGFLDRFSYPLLMVIIITGGVLVLISALLGLLVGNENPLVLQIQFSFVSFGLLSVIGGILAYGAMVVMSKVRRRM